MLVDTASNIHQALGYGNAIHAHVVPRAAYRCFGAAEVKVGWCKFKLIETQSQLSLLPASLMQLLDAQTAVTQLALFLVTVTQAITTLQLSSVRETTR